MRKSFLFCAELGCMSFKRPKMAHKKSAMKMAEIGPKLAHLLF
jgi:hypothetical protein